MRGPSVPSCLATVLLAGVALAQTPGDGPVAAWSFNEQLRGLVRDTTGHQHHGFLRGEVRYAPSPGGAGLGLGVCPSNAVATHDLA